MPPDKQPIAMRCYHCGHPMSGNTVEIDLAPPSHGFAEPVRVHTHYSASTARR